MAAILIPNQARLKRVPVNDKYSLFMYRIKIKSPAIFLWNEQHVFVCWFITFQSVILWRYYNDKKAYRILAVLAFKMSAA